MLTLPRQLSEALRLTPAQFADLCAANPDAVLELAADGRLIEMTPCGGETGRRNSRLVFQLEAWARSRGDWCVFDSSTGFLLPDGSVLSPDASAVPLERWQALTPAERQGFAPLCPDLVVELASTTGASPSDRLPELRRRMAAYQANGARLGWLLLPETRCVEVWRPSGEPQRLEGLAVLDGEPELPALRLDLAELWAA
jgi:Uma2 family endonuclease